MSRVNSISESQLVSEMDGIDEYILQDFFTPNEEELRAETPINSIKCENGSLLNVRILVTRKTQKLYELYINGTKDIVTHQKYQTILKNASDNLRSKLDKALEKNARFNVYPLQMSREQIEKITNWEKVSDQDLLSVLGHKKDISDKIWLSLKPARRNELSPGRQYLESLVKQRMEQNFKEREATLFKSFNTKRIVQVYGIDMNSIQEEGYDTVKIVFYDNFLADGIKEGIIYTIDNLTRSAVTIKEEIELAGDGSTIIRPQKQVPDSNLLELSSRKATNFSSLYDNSWKCHHGLVDLVGYIANVKNLKHDGGTTILLIDKNCRRLCIQFENSTDDTQTKESIGIGQIIAIVNLSFKQNLPVKNNEGIPELYFTNETELSTEPSWPHLLIPFGELAKYFLVSSEVESAIPTPGQLTSRSPKRPRFSLSKIHF